MGYIGEDGPCLVDGGIIPAYAGNFDIVKTVGRDMKSGPILSLAMGMDGF